MTSHTAPSVIVFRTLAATFVVLAFSANASFAQPSPLEEEPRKITVKYGDLNLGTEEGSRELYGRLVAAARYVCPGAGSLVALNQNLQAQRCINDSVERAVKDVRNPKFAEVANSRMR